MSELNNLLAAYLRDGHNALADVGRPAVPRGMIGNAPFSPTPDSADKTILGQAVSQAEGDYRSAVTGRYATKSANDANPREHVKEARPAFSIPGTVYTAWAFDAFGAEVPPHTAGITAYLVRRDTPGKATAFIQLTGNLAKKFGAHWIMLRASTRQEQAVLAVLWRSYA